MVELIIERKGDREAFVTRSGGGPVPQARLGITLDGYSAPLTAGNFAANVQDGVYNGHPVNASYASVLAGRGLQPGAALSLATECIAGFTHADFRSSECKLCTCPTARAVC